MNAAQARQIDINRVAEWLGLHLSHKKGRETWWKSPKIPDQETASLKTDDGLNTFIDYSQTPQKPGKDYLGGSTIDLWMFVNGFRLDDPQGFKAALSALSQLGQYRNTPAPLFAATEGRKAVFDNEKKKNDRYKLKKQPCRIWMDSLKAEIERRRYSPKLADKYLKQVYFTDTVTGKDYNGLGFKNDKGGLEISIPGIDRATGEPKTFKTNINGHSPTTFDGTGTGRRLIFEGRDDFISWLHLNQIDCPVDKTHVLNSVSFAASIAEAIATDPQGTTEVLLFMDNDEAGEQAKQRIVDILEPTGIMPKPQNHLYTGFKANGKPLNDLSDYLQENPAARFTDAPTAPKYFDDSASANHFRNCAVRPKF